MDYKLILRQINSINKDINRGVLKILINYKTKEYFIGDSVLRMRYLKLIRNYFFNAKITINLHHRIDLAMLQHNPYVDKLTCKDLEALIFSDYDLIIAIGGDMDLFTEIANKYSRKLHEGSFNTGVFSLTKYLNIEKEKFDIVPAYQELHNFIIQERNKFPLKKEIFILNEEREWANRWFRLNGVESHEKIIIIVDSASLREKMLTLEVHFEMIQFFLENKSTKILVFDEIGKGKSLFYNEWLGNKFRNRLIFAEKLEFRKELAILASNYVRFILGPCTGIMHCASAIHNVFASKYEKTKEQPNILVYAGKDTAKNQHKSIWWGDDEEAKCCVLKDIGDKQKEISWINPSIKNYLPCSEYTSEILQNVIKTRF